MTDEKILLTLLPFWTPLVPPLGITSLKSFLACRGYDVKAVDSNTERMFKAVFNRYIDRLRESLPEHKRGNLTNIGYELIQNHMMAFLNLRGDQRDEGYEQLLLALIQKNFFCEIDPNRLWELDEMIRQLFETFRQYFTALLKREEPTVLGISVFRGTLAASICAFELAKQMDPRIITVMGGGIFSQEIDIEGSYFKNFLQRYPFIDKIIVGEGETLFLRFLEGRLPPSQKLYTIEDVDNEIFDISSGITLDYSDYNLDYYNYIGAYTSRSCPFQCTFCAETKYWGQYRKKAEKAAARELVNLYERYNGQLFLMCDSLLNPVIQGLAGEFENINIPIYWDGYLRIDRQSCDEEKVLSWRRGGFYRARLGIESGSARVLQLMNKKITISQVRQSLINLAKAGIKTTTYWIVGYPGETEADFEETLRLIEELQDYIYEAECNHFRYFIHGQVNSRQWQNQGRLLYPEDATDRLVFPTWVLNGPPSREETMERVNRFEAHRERLAIPNPYNIQEIYEADRRWKKLQKNAVPSILEFKNPLMVDECRDVSKVIEAGKKMDSLEDFNF